MEKIDVLSKWEGDKVGKKLYNRFYGTKANPSEWDAAQKDKKAFGVVYKKGIDPTKMNEEEYMKYVKEFKAIKFGI